MAEFLHPHSLALESNLSNLLSVQRTHLKIRHDRAFRLQPLTYGTYAKTHTCLDRYLINLYAPGLYLTNVLLTFLMYFIIPLFCSYYACGSGSHFIFCVFLPYVNVNVKFAKIP